MPNELDKALIAACDGGDIDAVTAALDAGANPNAMNTWSNLAHMQGTALKRASKHGHVEIARVLCHRGADVNAGDTFNETALHAAAFHGQVDVVQLLVEQHARLDAPNNFGRTALHFAASNLRYDVVLLLIKAGADINVKDRAGTTPLDSALLYRKRDVANLLKEHGAMASLIDEDREVDKATLRRELSFKEAELKYGAYKEWKDILLQYREGDEFWEYSSSNEDWQALMGQSGLVMLRNNRVVDGVVTEMN